MKRIRIECKSDFSYQTKITDADTGEEIQNVYKAEITLDVRKEVCCILHMYNVEVDVVANDVKTEVTTLDATPLGESAV